MVGKYLFSHQGPKYGGKIIVDFPPGSEEIPQKFSAPAAGCSKNLFLEGFVVVSSDKLLVFPTYMLLA